MNDSAFVDGLRKRDSGAIRHLMQNYVPSIWRFVYVQTGSDHHLAEDIVSETVVALLRTADSGADIQSPSAWLRAVATHKIQDHFRAAARIQHLVHQIKETGSAIDNVDAPAQQELAERRTQIREVMNELPERERMLLEWKYLEKRSVREIAGMLDLSEKAVESILFRARREFREKLARKEQRDESSDPNAPAGRKRDVGTGLPKDKGHEAIKWPG